MKRKNKDGQLDPSKAMGMLGDICPGLVPPKVGYFEEKAIYNFNIPVIVSSDFTVHALSHAFRDVLSV